MSNFNVESKVYVGSLIEQGGALVSDVGKQRYRERSSNVSFDKFMSAWKTTHDNLPLRTEISFDGLNYSPSYFTDQIEYNLGQCYRVFAKISNGEYSAYDAFSNEMRFLDFSNIKFPNNLYDYLESCWSWEDGSVCRVDNPARSEELGKQIASNRTERGGRLSKYISSNLGKIMRQVSDCWKNEVISKSLYDSFSSDVGRSREYLESYLRYVGYLNNINDKEYTIVLTTEVDAFMRLGHNNIDSNSCFKTTGEYSGAPVQLGVMKNSFVAYLKSGDQVVGRAWGFLNIDDNKFALSNVYSKGSGVPGDKDMVRMILLDALSHLVGYDDRVGNYHIVHVDDTYGIYWNGDLRSNVFDKCLDDFTFALIEPVCGHCCADCNARINPNCDDYLCDANGRYICENCMCDYVYLDCRGDYYHVNSCIQDYNCDWLHENDAVQLTAGAGAGEYAHEEQVVELWGNGYCLDSECNEYSSSSVLSGELCCPEEEHVWECPDGDYYHVSKDAGWIETITSKEVE